MIKQERLDFLRGVAAAYVVINHARGHFFIGGQKLLDADPSLFNKLVVSAFQATSLGAEAVVLFFVLSGFAMAHSVAMSRSVPNFYLKRTIRIWPPYIAATLFAGAVGLLVGVHVPLSAFAYIDASTRVTPQFWSLPYEVVFYALCPLILASQRNVKLFGIVGVIGTLLTVLLRGIGLNPWHSFALDFLGNEATFFAAGALAYYLLDRVPSLSGRGLSGATAALLGVVLAAKLMIGSSNLVSNLAMIALAVLLIKNLPDRIAGFRPANLGFFSYSIYLFHFALLALAGILFRLAGVEPGSITNPFIWMLLVPVVVAACFGLYWITERLSNKAVASLRRSQIGHRDPCPGRSGDRALPAGRAADRRVDVEHDLASAMRP